MRRKMGITIFTKREHVLVYTGEQAPLVKIVPFGIASARVLDVEAMAQATAAILTVDTLMVSGQPSAP
jgi:hypothetical protein